MRRVRIAEVGSENPEPQRTILGKAWSRARRRSRKLNAEPRALFTALFDQIEEGWNHVRRFQTWYEAHSAEARERHPYADILNYLDGDLVDVFRVVAAEACCLVPGWAGWESEADPGELEAEAETFSRYLTLLVFAAETADEPDGLRALTREAGVALHGWDREIGRLVKAINDEVISPKVRRAA